MITPSPIITIQPVRSSHDLATVTALFKAYVVWLDIDLTFQDFETELAILPGKYAPPDGEILVAKDPDGNALGCIALRPLAAGVGELKRLWVAPAGRGKGVGRKLVEAMLEIAWETGYEEVRLDTLPSMMAAIGLYGALGFKRSEAYYETPVEGTVFFRKVLAKDIRSGNEGKKEVDGGREREEK